MKSLKTFFSSRTTDELLLAALVFLLPFERIPAIDIFGISIRPSFIVAIVLIIRALAGLAREKFKLLPRDLSVKLLAAFMLWITITIFAALNIPRAGMVVVFTLFTAVTAIAIRVLYKPQYLSTIVKALLWSSLLVGLFGLYQYFGNMAELPNWVTGMRSQYTWEIFGFPRIHSTALEPLYYCSYLLIPISYLVVHILTKRTLGWKHATLFVLLSGSVVLTLSRGGIVAMAVLIISAIGLTTIQRRTGLKPIGKLLGLLALAIVAAFLIISTVSREPLNKTITNGEEGAAGYTNQLKKTSLDGSGDDRAITRQAAISLIAEDGKRSIVGIGPGQFGPYYQNNTTADGEGWRIVNNETLELLVEYGIIGFLLFASFMLAVLYKAWQSACNGSGLSSIVATALICYTIALAVQYQTFSTLYIMHVWVVIGLLMALGASRNKSHGRVKE